MQQQAVAKVQRAVRELPADFREVIVLRELEGLSYKEIAAVARIPIGTVMSRLARARERLLTILGPSRRTNWRTIVTCLEAGRVLDAYIDNELEPADAGDLQAHLALCAGCRELLAAREALGRLVRRLPYYPASDQLRAKIAREHASAIQRSPADLGGGVGARRIAWRHSGSHAVRARETRR